MRLVASTTAAIAAAKITAARPTTCRAAIDVATSAQWAFASCQSPDVNNECYCACNESKSAKRNFWQIRTSDQTALRESVFGKRKLAHMQAQTKQLIRRTTLTGLADFRRFPSAPMRQRRSIRLHGLCVAQVVAVSRAGCAKTHKPKRPKRTNLIL